MKKKEWRDHDDDISETWREYRRQQQQRRAARLEPRSADIESLRAKNFTVRRLTDYQFRVDERLDFYPIHKRWHDIRTNRRGSYRSETALAAAIRLLRGPDVAHETASKKDPG